MRLRSSSIASRRLLLVVGPMHGFDTKCNSPRTRGPQEPIGKCDSERERKEKEKKRVETLAFVGVIETHAPNLAALTP